MIHFVRRVNKIPRMLSFYFTNKTHNINYIWTLKAYLPHVSGQVYQLQGDTNDNFKAIRSDKLLFVKFLLL